ncbi:hypothetical protein C6P46_005130 [Rhodotorula mucilaginosa]|uniref:Proteophosphoglycan ppg4 n=1 Tax=Rhodotorula mucilaginosa TaxID=5537 RepID=A0A9P6VZD8_RHOMI|nr:hypothetical protein C6P46_005130 [Rhodotorula mucilaginosa]
METAARIPEAINSFAAAIAAVPVPLLTINSTLLNSLLSTVASDLAPALPTLAQAQQEALLTNSTFLAQQFGSLSSFLGDHFRTDLSAVSHADAIAMVEIGATRYDIMAVWAPDVWAIVVLFVAAAFLKLALVGMLTPQAISRAVRAAESSSVAPEKPSREERELARSRLQKPARAALGHALNLIISTIVIVLQAMAWRLFVLPSTPIRPLDAKLMTAAVKLLLTGYAADLLFGDLRAEIFLHHFFTFALLFIGQLAAFKCQDFYFFRLAQYLLLQGTLEQTTYASMVAWHMSTYLRLQDYRPNLQRRLLKAAYRLMTVSKVITFPQKFAPAGFALYWLARMWPNIDGTPWGRTWIVWCTLILVLLLIIQVKFADDAFPLAAHMRYKAVGGTPPSRIGPVFTVLGRCRTVITRRRRRTSPPMAGFPTASEDGRSRSTTNAWIDQKVEEGTAIVKPVSKETSKTPFAAPHELPLPASTRNSICSTRTGCVGLARLPALPYDSWDASSHNDEVECTKSSSQRPRDISTSA